MNRKQMREYFRSKYDLDKLTIAQKMHLNRRFGMNIKLPRQCKQCKAIITNDFIGHLKTHGGENNFYNAQVIKDRYWLYLGAPN